MRENPWHIRRPTTEHYQRFRNLIDLHQLTCTWLEDLNLDQPTTPHQIKRVGIPGIAESLRVLENLTSRTVPKDLEDFLDESYPDELLDKLQQTIWVMHSWSLRSIFEQTPRDEWAALRNVLEQSSWKAGRDCCKRRWKQIPVYATKNLRGILAAFQDSPLSGYPKFSSFLIKRATAMELDLELLQCPHNSPFLEVETVADDLCPLHTHYMRGYVYHLNTTVLMDYKNGIRGSKKQDRCSQRWYFHLGGPHTFSSKMIH